MAEITGRATGYCGGKGGSMHITAMRHGMLGADAIVAGSVAIATGAAYALRLQGRDAVVVSFFGDGASNQGIFHEAANLASVLSAPVIFVCENNQWAISTPFRDAVNVPDVAIRANGYGFPGEVVDGNDFFAVREAPSGRFCARAGEGPTLIEAKSYRITPHSAATPNDNQPPEELELWRRATRSSASPRRSSSGSSSRGAGRGDRGGGAATWEEATEYALGSPFPARRPRLRTACPELSGMPTAVCDDDGGLDSRELTMSEALNEAPARRCAATTAFVIGETSWQAGGLFKVTDGLLAEFGSARVIDSPISEAGISGAGAAPRSVGGGRVVRARSPTSSRSRSTRSSTTPRSGGTCPGGQGRCRS